MDERTQKIRVQNIKQNAEANKRQKRNNFGVRPVETIGGQENLQPFPRRFVRSLHLSGVAVAAFSEALGSVPYT